MYIYKHILYISYNNKILLINEEIYWLLPLIKLKNLKSFCKLLDIRLPTMPNDHLNNVYFLVRRWVRRCICVRWI